MRAVPRRLGGPRRPGDGQPASAWSCTPSTLEPQPGGSVCAWNSATVGGAVASRSSGVSAHPWTRLTWSAVTAAIGRNSSVIRCPERLPGPPCAAAYSATFASAIPADQSSPSCPSARRRATRRSGATHGRAAGRQPSARGPPPDQPQVSELPDPEGVGDRLVSGRRRPSEPRELWSRGVERRSRAGVRDGSSPAQRRLSTTVAGTLPRRPAMVDQWESVGSPAVRTSSSGRRRW